jgi:CDP-diacylglycerol--inositol 3-phosphatidyltransferase
VKVCIFVPNLIGWVRFVTLFVGVFFALAGDEHTICFPIFYTISQGLDAIDGKAAHYFNQCTRFGAALDMVCDRASVATMFMVLAILYPNFSMVFVICFVLDFGSHWL